MSTIKEWMDWAEENDADVKLKIKTHNGEVSETRLWIWLNDILHGVSIPIGSEPDDVRRLVEEEGKKKIRNAEEAAKRDRHYGEKLLSWAEE